MRTVTVVMHSPSDVGRLNAAALQYHMKKVSTCDPSAFYCILGDLENMPEDAPESVTFLRTSGSWTESMNAIGKAATSDWLLFVDPNFILDYRGLRDYLDKIPSYMKLAVPYGDLHKVPLERCAELAKGSIRLREDLGWPSDSRPTGLPLLVSSELFRKVGGYDETLPKVASELDLFRRLSEERTVKTFEHICAYSLPVGGVYDPKDKAKHLEIARDAANELNVRPLLESILEEPVVEVCPTEPLEDTALILSYSYENDVRHQSVLTASMFLGDLSPMPRIFFVHVALPGDPTCEDLKSIVEGRGGRFVTLHGEERHRHVFHKEDVYNKTVREMLPDDVKYLIFLDADSHPTNTDWAYRTREALAKLGDGFLLQPWSTFSDTVDKRLGGPSMSKRIHDEGSWKNHANPGLSVAMTRTCFHDIDGFPTSCPVGAGDTMLMLEVRGFGGGGPSYMKEFPYFRRSVRRVKHKENAYITERMVHENHGSLKSRCYYTRHVLMQEFWPFDDDIKVDDMGLLSVRPNSAIQYCMSRRREAVSAPAARRLVAKARAEFNEERAKPFDKAPAFFSRDDFDRALRRKPEYWKGRLGYHTAAVEMLKGLPISAQCLEIGSFGLHLITNAEHMGYWEEDECDTRHDASVEPWPYSSKRFGAVVALQVVEHLSNQQAFFRQAARVSDWVLVSLPWKWAKGDSMHTGIDWDTVNDFVRGVKPWDHRQEENRMLIVYRSEDLEKALNG